MSYVFIFKYKACGFLTDAAGKMINGSRSYEEPQSISIRRDQMFPDALSRLPCAQQKGAGDFASNQSQFLHTGTSLSTQSEALLVPVSFQTSLKREISGHSHSVGFHHSPVPLKCTVHIPPHHKSASAKRIFGYLPGHRRQT